MRAHAVPRRGLPFRIALLLGASTRWAVGLHALQTPAYHQRPMLPVQPLPLAKAVSTRLELQGVQMPLLVGSSRGVGRGVAASSSSWRQRCSVGGRMDARLVAATVGGLFAGGLHAVTGPDHLAALLPLCMSRRWWVALTTGAYWGLGHGIGAALVGALAFAVRGALNLDVLSAYMEAAVGISIVIIGVNGIRESRQWASEAEVSMPEGPTEVSAAPSTSAAPNASAAPRACASKARAPRERSSHLATVSSRWQRAPLDGEPLVRERVPVRSAWRAPAGRAPAGRAPA